MKKLFSKCFNAVLVVALALTLCPALETMAEEQVSEFVMDGTMITGYNGAGGDITLRRRLLIMLLPVMAASRVW